MVTPKDFNAGGFIKAKRREKKRRRTMAVHGRGIKTIPRRGVPKAAQPKRRRRVR